MSEQQKKRNSLLKSSLNIKSISSSVTSFSQTLNESNVTARQISSTVRNNNIFKRNLISKENEFFRKRRENIRRKDREDELEAANVQGPVKRQGSLVAKSTRGFLGRILDFFGIILIGWFVERLPKIIESISGLIGRIKNLTKFLSGFIEGVTDFFTGIGDVITQAFDALPKFDLLGFKNQSEGILKQTENTVQKLNQDFFFAQDKFNKEVDKSYNDDDRVDKNTRMIKLPGIDDDKKPVTGTQVEQTTEGELDKLGQEIGIDDDTTDATGGPQNIVGATTNFQEEEFVISDDDTAELTETDKKLEIETRRLEKLAEEIEGGDGKKMADKIEDTMGGMGGSESGGGTSDGTTVVDNSVSTNSGENIKKNKKQVDDDPQRTTPIAGDYYKKDTKRGARYFVLRPDGTFSGGTNGSNVKPRTGIEFAKSVFFPTVVGASTVDLFENENNEKVIEGTNSNMFIDTLKSKEYNLDMIFKKDRPFIILTDSTSMNSGSGLNLSGSSDLNINFSDSSKFDLDLLHSIILNSN